jgi:hypothetical protein
LEGFRAMPWMDWIDANLPAGSRIIVTDVNGVATDTDKVFLLLDPDRDIVRQVMDQRVDYLLYLESSDSDRQYLKPLLRAYSANLSIIHQVDGWRLYKIDY